MLKRAAILSAAVFAGAGLATSASAQTFSPSPVSSFTMTGTLAVGHSQAGSTTCSVTMTGDIPSGGATGAITGVIFAPGDWRCGWLLVGAGLPWSITPTSTSSASVSLALGASYACSGVAYATWVNGAPSTITFPGPVVGSSPACTISGTLSVSGGLTIL